jgi:GMP synthase-like glutamine amidotransferase
MKRLLYVSQLADASDARRGATTLEAASVTAVFTGLGAELVRHDATLGAPPDPTGFDGVVVGGSFGSANHEEPWRIALREWLGAHRSIPLFGICGGHQLLARALGGTVGVAPGPQLGVYPLDLPGVPGFTGRVVQLHFERVEVPPEGAEVWATDEMDIQALRYGPTRWTVQFHPEMDDAIARYAGTANGLDDRAWAELDVAVAGGRVLLAAWVAAL